MITKESVFSKHCEFWTTFQFPSSKIFQLAFLLEIPSSRISCNLRCPLFLAAPHPAPRARSARFFDPPGNPITTSSFCGRAARPIYIYPPEYMQMSALWGALTNSTRANPGDSFSGADRPPRMDG